MSGSNWFKNRLLALISWLVLAGPWNGVLFAQQHKSYEADFPSVSHIAYHQYFTDSCENSNISFRADFPLSGVNALVDEVNLLEQDMISYLSLSQEREKIEIFIFDQKTNYLEFLKKEFPDAPLDRRALFIKKPNSPGIVVLQLTREIDDDVRHEMTHAFLHSRFSSIPLWLDEGLAEYFELPRDQRAFQKPYMKKAVGRFMFSKTVPSLQKLEKIDDFYSFGLKEYQQSWAWIHFMIHHSQETHQLLAAYLTQIGSGKTANSLEQYLADTIPDYKNEYLRHFESWNQRQDENAEQLRSLTPTESNASLNVPDNHEEVAAEQTQKNVVFR